MRQRLHIDADSGPNGPPLKTQTGTVNDQTPRAQLVTQ